MKTIRNQASHETETVLDLKTIRQRVKQIKAGWTEETSRQRAEEGKRRRAELERLLGSPNSARKNSQCDFTLVV